MSERLEGAHVFGIFFLAIALLWVAWLVYWMVAANRVKAAKRSESRLSRLSYSIPLWFAAVLLADRHLGPFLNAQLYPLLLWVVIVGTALTAAGVAYAVWARVTLGANWSANVTVKQDHELVRSGPYGLSRHPIYTGMLLAFVGTALAVGEARALIAIVLVVGSFWYKIRLEEKMMRETFGAAYDTYSRRVKALIPFLL